MHLLRARNRPHLLAHLVRVLDRAQACLRARTRGAARIDARFHALATIPGERCGLNVFGNGRDRFIMRGNVPLPEV